MNSKEYMEYLATKSKYCSCPQLSDLSELGKKAEKLEKICEKFNSKLDLENPKKQDLDNLLDYANISEKLEGIIKEYYNEVSSLLDKKYLKLNLHFYDESSWKKVKISFNFLNRLPYNSVVTFDCSFCEQQIDVLSSNDILSGEKKEHIHKE